MSARRFLIPVLLCLTLSGCYQGYQLGGCDRETATQHTENDFLGVQWCAPNGKRPHGFGISKLDGPLM